MGRFLRWVDRRFANNPTYVFALVTLTRPSIFHFQRKARTKRVPGDLLQRCVLACATCPFLDWWWWGWSVHPTLEAKLRWTDLFLEVKAWWSGPWKRLASIIFSGCSGQLKLKLAHNHQFWHIWPHFAKEIPFDFLDLAFGIEQVSFRLTTNWFTVIRHPNPNSFRYTWM